jgi:hypothetical protein
MTAVELVGSICWSSTMCVSNSGIGRLSSFWTRVGQADSLPPGESPPPSDLGAPYRRDGGAAMRKGPPSSAAARGWLPSRDLQASPWLRTRRPGRGSHATV